MAAGMSIAWQVSPGDMAKKTEAYGKRLLQAVFALATEWASRLQADMKASHPWKNQTGEAEAKLFGRVLRTAFGAILILGHGARHGIFLERKFAGRDAVVIPTLQRAMAPIMASLQALVR